MTIIEFLDALEREHARSPFVLVGGRVLRQEKTGWCPLVAVANGQKGGNFQSNGEFFQAANLLGLSTKDANAIADAADIPYSEKCWQLALTMRERLARLRHG